MGTDEMRFSAWVGGESGEVVVSESGPVFLGKDGKRIEGDELRRLGVDLPIPEGPPDSEANIRVRRVREALMRAAIPVTMAQALFV